RDASAAARAVLGPDAAAVRLDEPARDRQTEPGAAAAPRGIAAPEAVEHPFFGFGREAVARVLDADADGVLRLRPYEYGDGPVGGRVPERVRQQVVEHALDLVRGAEHGPDAVLDPRLQLDAPRERLRLEAAQARVDERGERRLAELQRQCARVDPCELEQIVDERAQGVDLAAHRRDVVARLHESVLDGLEHRLQRRERRPQVVARPGDELAAGVEQLLDSLGHLVERRAELGELARAGLRRARRQLAAREAGRRT